jgi:hypothetical protein
MKTKRFAVTVLAVAITVMASAMEKPKMNVEPLNADRMAVTVQNQNAGDVELSILAESGDVVHYKQYRKPGASLNTIFDVKHLDNGNYTMKIVMNGLILERSLAITSNEIKVGAMKESPAPYFHYNGKEIIITQLNLDKEKYSIEIYDDKGLLHHERIGRISPILIGFDLSQLDAGNFDIVINSAQNRFSYQVQKPEEAVLVSR